MRTISPPSIFTTLPGAPKSRSRQSCHRLHLTKQETDAIFFGNSARIFGVTE